jgi:hypothetical protein
MTADREALPRLKTLRGWNEVHDAHCRDLPVIVTFDDGRTFDGPVTMISDSTFEIDSKGMRTTFFWPSVHAVEVSGHA